MTFNYKICSSDEATNLAYGWATHIISIIEEDDIFKPDFSEQAKHFITTKDKILQRDYEEFISDIKIADMLIHCSDMSDSAALALIIACNTELTSVGSVFHNFLQAYPDVIPNKEIIETCGNTRLANFFKVWYNYNIDNKQ